MCAPDLTLGGLWEGFNAALQHHVALRGSGRIHAALSKTMARHVGAPYAKVRRDAGLALHCSRRYASGDRKMRQRRIFRADRRQYHGMRGLAQFGQERAMGTLAAEFEPPGTNQIGIAVLERGTLWTVAENRQLIQTGELRGACQRDELA